MKKIALLFPGQGSQYVGMGKDLYKNFAVAKEVFDQANEALGFDLKSLCFEGNMEKLTKTENAQPALLTMSLAAFKVFNQEIGIEPLYMAGHSLGEFSALTCAGVLNFEDAVRIVHKRGKFMQEAIKAGIGSMVAVSNIDKKVIEEECRNCSNDAQIVVVSNYNSLDQTVISGHNSAVNEVSQRLILSGAAVIPLKVGMPFHSPLMKHAADKLREELQNYKFNNFNCNVLSNVTALPYLGAELIIENLATQVIKPVKWYETMQYLANHEVEIAIELGPHTVLRNLVKKNIPSVKAFSYDKEEDVIALKQSLSANREEGKADKNAYLKLITRCMAIAVCTKNNNWNNEEYEKGVTEPYRRIKLMHEELENKDDKPSIEQMNEAMEMLKSVFSTKQTEAKEQVERFNQIFRETGLRHLFNDINLPR